MNKASAFDMDALDSRIRELVAYARERDGEDRSNLFRNLVDLFLTGKAPKINPTRSQLLDVLQALIPHVEPEGRRTACELVANMSNPPMDLVMRLVQDRASLVTTLLTHVTFDDDDLIELIECTGREHHQLIAAREDLSANIWIALARAAPSAPPFDHQSTLALWSDDLGITQTKPADAEEAPRNTSRSKTGPLSPPIGDPKKAAEKRARRQHAGTASSGQNPRPKSATVTPLHPERSGSASIRILRTDEDLIAAKAKSAEPDINDGSQETQEAEKPVSPTADTDQADKTERIEPTFDAPASVTRHAMDPGPGGWAWISDRDGFVTSLSTQGRQLLGEEFDPVGSSVLDLLGLNTKLGHPVARAFQRRSAIHDAPIFLSAMDEKHQHWTLEATPFFSSCGGIFEGYEGTLTPVVPASEDVLPAAIEDDGSALFLDEITSRPAANLRVMPASFTDQASVFQTSANVEDVAEDQELGAQAVEALKTIQQALEDIPAEEVVVTPPKVKAQSTEDTPHNPPKTAPSSNGSDVITDAAASVVKEVLAEALAPLTASAAQEAASGAVPETSGAEETQNPDTKGTSALKAEALTSDDVSAHIAATFDLLEQALAQLTEAGKKSGDPQIRLQGEIASACVRSLKEQLK